MNYTRKSIFFILAHLMMNSCTNESALAHPLEVSVVNPSIDKDTKSLNFVLNIENLGKENIILHKWRQHKFDYKEGLTPMVSCNLRNLIENSGERLCRINADETLSFHEIFSLEPMQGNITFLKDMPKSYYTPRSDILLPAGNTIKTDCSIPIKNISIGRLLIKLTGKNNPIECYFNVTSSLEIAKNR